MEEKVSTKGIWKRFFRICRQTTLPWHLLITYIVLNASCSILAVKVPQVSGNFFAGDASVKSVSMFIGIELLITGVSQMSLYFNHLARFQMNRNLRNTLWGKLLKLKPSYFDRTSASTLISRITIDADSVNEYVMDIILGLIFQLYTLYLSIQEMNSISTKAGIMLLAFLPLSVVFAFVVGRFNLRLESNVKRKMADLTSYMSEILSSIPVIKAFNRQKYEYERGKKEIDQYYRSNVLIIIFQVISDTIGLVVASAPQVVILYLGVRMLTANEVDAAGWYVFYCYAGTFIDFANSLGRYWYSMKATQGRLSKIADILDEKEEGIDAYVNELVASGDILFEDVSFGYDEEKEVLHDATFSIPKNKNTVIIGYSGSGKSTILKLLGRMYEPTAGRVMTEGTNIETFNLTAWRDNIGFVVQNTPLLSGSIRDNILYGIRREVSDEEIMDVLKLVRLDRFVAALPEGLDYEVGQFGAKLSGGQKQKISIARAILSNANLLLLDEPTASLDLTSTTEIIHTTDALRGKRTIVEVTHDIKAVEHADHIIVVNKDHTVVEGDRDYIQRTSEFYQELARGQEELA